MKKGHNLSHTEKAGRDMHIIAILIALGTGLFVGSRFEGAHDARQRFSSNRVRTNASLGAWLKRTIVVGISVVALILLPRRPGMTSLTRCTAATGRCNWSCRAVPRWHRTATSVGTAAGRASSCLVWHTLAYLRLRPQPARLPPSSARTADPNCRAMLFAPAAAVLNCYTVANWRL